MKLCAFETQRSNMLLSLQLLKIKKGEISHLSPACLNVHVLTRLISEIFVIEKIELSAYLKTLN